MSTSTPRHARRKPLLVVLSLICVVALVALGAFATFTSSDTRSEAVSTGTVDVHIGDGTQTGQLADPVVNMAAGDTRQRAFTIENDSSLPLSILSVTVSPTPTHEADPLITHAQGLEVKVDRCSVAYTETDGQTIGDVTDISTFACSGTEVTGVYNKVELGAVVSVIGHDSVVSGVQDAGADEFVKVTLLLPQAAPNVLQDEATSVTYTVNATQRLAQELGSGASVPIPAAPQNVAAYTPSSPGGTASIYGELPSNVTGEQVDKYEVTILEVSGPTTGPRGPDETPAVYDEFDPPLGYFSMYYTGLMAFANDPPSTYSVVVRAHTAAGWGPFSDPVEFTPQWFICC